MDSNALTMKFMVLFITLFFSFAGCNDRSIDIRYHQTAKTETTQKVPPVEPSSIQNSPPRIISSKLIPPLPGKGDIITAHVLTEDTDGDNVLLEYKWRVNETAYTWIKGSSLDAELEKGDIVVVKIIPFDGKDKGLSIINSVRVKNSHPEISTKLSDVTIKNNKCQARVIAYDVDGDELSYSLKHGPESMLIDKNTGIVTWKRGKEKNNKFKITISVKDSEGAESILNLTVEGCYPELQSK